MVALEDAITDLNDWRPPMLMGFSTHVLRRRVLLNNGIGQFATQLVTIATLMTSPESIAVHPPTRVLTDWPSGHRDEMTSWERGYGSVTIVPTIANGTHTALVS